MTKEGDDKMVHPISGNTAAEVWEIAVSKIIDSKKMQTGRTGDTFELLHTFVSISDPRQKWVYNRLPPISIAYALAELVWIVNGDNRSSIINFWNPKLEKYAGKSDTYHGAYGERIRKHFGFDQLQKAYEALKNNPESRQVVIQIYDTRIDFPIKDGSPQNEDIPCNICSLIKVRNNRLEWTQIMRSNDVLLGMPYNFIQFMGLQEILAGWLGVELGSYNHFSDSLHLYSRDYPKVGVSEVEFISNPDSLSIDKDVSEKIFKEIYSRMEKLCNSNISESEIVEIAQLNSKYDAYDNIMLILSAYVARKLNYCSLTDQIISLCKNDLYVRMWNNWSSSF